MNLITQFRKIAFTLIGLASFIFICTRSYSSFFLTPSTEAASPITSLFVLISLPAALMMAFSQRNELKQNPTLIPALIFLNRENKKNAAIYFVMSFGVFSHIFLDWLLGGGMSEGVMWLFPFTLQTFKIHLLTNVLPGWQQGMDAVILLTWLWHEEVKHKIKDFI